ncbi:hypothetical protein ACM5Q9_00995 [Advenella sp. RU8]|uniref:hypothetical protein n=1 Tax=Advenella sp. RU8 TaxID=3399575 RepID=UPI003AAD6BD4
MSIDVQSLEKVYDSLSFAIDKLPEEKRSLFLTKLVLLLSNEIADAEKICRLVNDAATFEN